MPASEFLESFLAGTPPKEIRLIAARGYAPLPSGEMAELLVHLSADPDADVAAQAELTLAGWDDEDLAALVRSRDCKPSTLKYFAAKSQSAPVLEGIVLNPLTPGSVIENLASRLPASLIEIALDNRNRLLGTPGILAGLRQNPAITSEVARLIQEIETEFFGDKKTAYRVAAGTEAEAAPPEDPSPLLEEVGEELSLEGLPLEPQEREAALSERLSSMTVRQKVQQALLGTREARAILIRDSNRQVSRSVLQSPKVSDAEIESFAAMRNVSDEILREIGNNRAWLRSYAVIQNLVRNPKTPPLISQRLLFRLVNRDLSLLSRDRSLPEAVRRNAERTLSQRSGQKSTG
jgi:hypothetical protein